MIVTNLLKFKGLVDRYQMIVSGIVLDGNN